MHYIWFSYCKSITFRQRVACYCSLSLKELIVVSASISASVSFAVSASVSVIVRRFNFLKNLGCCLEFYLDCCFPSCLVVYIGIGSLLKPLFRLLLRPLLGLLLRPLLMLLLRPLLMMFPVASAVA